MATVISYSELDTYRQCPFKHQLAYGERWVAPGDAPALDRGKRTHAALEFFYQDSLRTYNWNVAMNGAIHKAGLINENTGEPVDDTADLVKWMLDGYVEMWGGDLDWKIEAVEHPVQIKLPNTSIQIKGKIDLLLTDQKGRLWLVDHKTGATLPKDKDLDLDVQFGVYAWALRKLGRPVYGMIYNSIRTQRNKGAMELSERFSRTLLVRTDAELEQIARDASMDAREAYKALTLAKKNGTDRPRHFNTDTCRWRCPYTEACLHGAKDLRGGTRGYLSEIGFVQNFERH
jgi:RecB family exonuclease